MNEATKQFFAKLYLQKASSDDYVDWAFACLDEGLDSKSLRLLAALSKNHSIKADFEELFRLSLNELDWNYLSKKEVLIDYAKDLAKQILSGEIEPEDGIEIINKIYLQLNFPPQLEMWGYFDGHSAEWYDRSRWWIPFISTYNHERWLEAVKGEAKDLIETDFS